MSMWRIRTTFTGIQGAPYLSTMYFDSLISTPQATATAVGNFWNSVDVNLSSAQTWKVEDEVVEIDEVTGDALGVFGVTGPTAAGSVAGEVLPPATQALVRWRTGIFIGGKEVRGRTFVPGIPESQSTGVPIPGFITNTNTAATTLATDINTNLVIWSRTKGLFRPVTSGSTWNQFAVLRSRRL